jgi:glycosyltransferase involved in cell wall biosynthesis
MRVVFNTTYPTGAASLFYQQAFEGTPGIDFYKSNYEDYDVALFMTYDYAHIEGIKKKFPHLKIGMIDPRSPAVMTAMPYCDFLIVDGIEMEDYWRIANKPILRYVEYPKLPLTETTFQSIRQQKQKIRQLSDTIYIGYHGNSYHIMEGDKNLSPALASLSQKYDIELLLMHNDPPAYHAPRYKMALPEGVKVRRVKWSMENYINFLSLSDIGIVPNNLGIEPKNPATTGDPNTDYCLSFKMTSNPGRFAVFGLLGIPVVADFYPSALQYLQKGTGFVAHSTAGWYSALERLITSESLREEMGLNLQNLVNTEFDFGVQNKTLLSFLEDILKNIKEE